MIRAAKFEDRRRILLLQLHRFSVKQTIMLVRVFVFSEISEEFVNNLPYIYLMSGIHRNNL
jgi:hypothetical protein